MKKLILFTSLLCFLFSCKNENKYEEYVEQFSLDIEYISEKNTHIQKVFKRV